MSTQPTTSQGPAPVVLGLSASHRLGPELDWAADEAAQRGRALHVVHVWDIASATTPWDVGLDRLARDELRARAERQVHAAQQHVAGGWPDLEVRGCAVQGVPWHVLTRFAATAELTVIGSRGLGALRSLIQGSVGAAIAAHTERPLVVVHTPPPAPSDGPVVVAGVDGSPVSQDVLAVAFDFASRHRRPLRVLFCYSPDLLLTSPWHSQDQLFDEQADRWLAELVDGWQEKYPDVLVRRHVERHHPVPALLDAADGQELLVLGTSSRHPRLGALVGSVSLSALQHANTAVALVPSLAARHETQGAVDDAVASDAAVELDPAARPVNSGALA